MSENYKCFIRELKRVMAINNMTPSIAAEYMKVSKATFYNWLGFKTVMSGDDMIRVIDVLMGGRYEKFGTLS